MAAKKEPAADLDLDSGKGGGGGKKMLILYAVIGVLVLAVVGMGALFFLGKGKGDGHEEPAAEAKHGEVVYIPLETMTVNFSAKGPARFLQVDMQALAYNPKLTELIKKHMPAIRNDLLMLLGSQTFEEVSTREGKEKLRTQVVETINRILSEQAKSPDKIETIYFTSFVMQ